MHSSVWSGAGFRLAGVCFSAISGLLIAGLAGAHGGGYARLSGVGVGPFWLTVWTSPEPVRAGELHVTVGVGGAGGEPDVPVLDAVVNVEISEQADGGVQLFGVATTEQSSNKFLYEVDFELPEPGFYLVTVNVSGAEGNGSASFDLTVIAAEASDWLRTLLVGGLVFVIAVWLLLLLKGK